MEKGVEWSSTRLSTWALVISLLESVQRRATKLLDCIASLSYEDRLKFLNLYSIEDRLKRGDMILMYRIMNDDLKIDKKLLFPVLKESITRGHHLKIDLGKPAHLDVRRNFFSQRVIIPWNVLPQHVAESCSIDSLKFTYDKWLGRF